MLYYAQGTAIITRAELLDKSVKELPQFYGDLGRGASPDAIEFSTGRLTVENLHRSFRANGGAPTPFQPIGPGRPLTIQIRQVYTGCYPAAGFLGGAKDMLLTSAVKSTATYQAMPRAVNFLTRNVEAHSFLSRPDPTEEGTPIVFYSPAMVDKSLTLGLEIVFDRWPSEVFDQLGAAFQGAAGIPLFLPYSTYMLAAGGVTKLLAGAGEALFDGKPALKVAEPVDLLLPGQVPAQPGFLILSQEDVDEMEPGFSADYHTNERGQVVDKDGRKYQGDVPFIVVSLDGTQNDEFAAWTPAAASAAVLSRFLGMRNGQHQPLNELINAMKLYNDYTFRKKVDRLDEQIDALPEGEKKEKLKEEREAALKNIMEGLLRPAS